MQNTKLSELIQEFIVITNSTFSEALEILNKSNCNLKHAIASYVLFKLQTNNYKPTDMKIQRNNMNLRKRRHQDLSNSGFKMDYIRTRNEPEIEPIIVDLCKSNSEEQNTHLSKNALQKILRSKKIVSWISRLDSFHKYDPTLIGNWTNGFENEKQITINKKLFDIYCQIKPKASSKNLQRSLVFFFQKKGWSNIALFDREKMVFIPTKKMGLYKSPKIKKRIIVSTQRNQKKEL
ncbi:hypothetical protein M0813_27794 [Anaeramoeba flamelloides]|uniref:Uncharacterized protein n=1 Tax=Anaeramoeba flamelloides TaxID=1746091 RepID=A0ABQ8XUY1_9EUKA|nr:hypothetical protein M0813_27794 [Anaeramoeba flamelloides]